MPSSTRPRRFIILPARGMQNNESPTGNPEVTHFLARAADFRTGKFNANTVSRAHSTPLVEKPQLNIKVVHSLHEDGAKLVELKDEQLSKLRLSQPGIRIIPEVFYKLQRLPRAKILKKAKARKTTSRTTGTFTVMVKDKENNPLKGITVMAFTNYDLSEGDEKKTRINGEVKFSFSEKVIERLYIYPDHSYWPYMFKSVKTSSGRKEYKLEEIDPAYKDGLKKTYGHLHNIGATKIKVGVIDTGVGPHDHIELVGGSCTVLDDDPADFGDYEGHGTHVAGIIGGTSPMKGVAPGVEILSYRVFPRNGGGASSYDIINAFDKALQDGCHILNLSLGFDQGDYDEGLSSAIKDAYYKGVLCFVATGNDGRLPVSFPASHPLVIAVTAFGKKETFPPKTEPFSSIKAPYGTDKKNFIADFSNIGTDVDMTGPGVGIVSCYPDNRYAVLSGTSMACPAICGMMARLLTKNPQVVNMVPGQARTDAFISLLAKHTKPLGFGAKFEGGGLPK